MATIFNAGSVLTAQVEWKDAFGNLTVVDDEVAPEWASSDETVATVAFDETTGVVTVTSTGVVGMVQISVRADADLDDGEVRELVATGDLEFIPGEAAAGTLTFVAA